MREEASSSQRRAPALPPGGRSRWLAAAIAMILGQGEARADSPGPADFRRDVLPILADNCFACHGPDAKARKAELRLDRKEAALRTRDPVIVPGDSAAERARSARHKQRPRRTDAAAEDGQEACRPGRSQSFRAGSTRGRPGAVIGLSSRRARPRPHPSTTRPGPETPSMPSSWPALEAAKVTPARGGTEDDSDPARHARPDRPSADAPEVDAFLADSSPDRLRDGRRSAAPFAPLRRAHGIALARRRPLRRHQRLSDRRRAHHVALARLGDRRLQPQHALRPVHHRAARRRPAAATRRSTRRSPPASTATIAATPRAASSPRSTPSSTSSTASRPPPPSGSA